MLQNNADIESPEGVDLVDYNDYPKIRGNILKRVRKAMVKSFPQSYGGVRMELSNVRYDNEDPFSLSDQKDALLKDKYLTKKLKGTVRIVDEATETPIEEKDLSLMRVPWLTDRGSFIHGGNEYTTIMQSRLMPGVYTRRQANGHLETQFNVKPGTGIGFRIGFEPDTAQYRIKISQANLHMYSLLKDLGVPDEELEKKWGTDIFKANRDKYDSRVLDKAFERLVPKKLRKADLPQEQKVSLIKDAFNKASIAQYVANRNLPGMVSAKQASEERAKWAGREAMQKVAAERIEALPFQPDYTPDEIYAEMLDEDFEKVAAAVGMQPTGRTRWPAPAAHRVPGRWRVLPTDPIRSPGVVEQLPTRMVAPQQPAYETAARQKILQDYYAKNPPPAPVPASAKPPALPQPSLAPATTPTTTPATPTPTPTVAANVKAGSEVETPKDQFVRIHVKDGDKRLMHHFLRADKWGSPAGKVDPGETPRQAALRELLERTGLEGIEDHFNPIGEKDGFHEFETDFSNLKQVAKPGERGGYSTETKWEPAEKAAALNNLLEAKDHSDKKQYGAKHRIMALMMYKAPDEFLVDSDDGKFLGITHAPTGFRMHLPKNIVPAVVRANTMDSKTASIHEDFQPDFDPDDLRESYNSIYGHVGPQLASMKSWPKEWLDDTDPSGWLSWYEQYHAGRRADTDEKQIRRWKSFKARHGAQLKKNPTARRAYALKNWGIDATKMLDDDTDRENLISAMKEYKDKATKDYQEKKAAFTDDDVMAIAQWLNNHHGAGLPLDVPVDQLEQAIMQFISNGMDEGVNPAVLQAGIAGQEQADKTIEQLSKVSSVIDAIRNGRFSELTKSANSNSFQVREVTFPGNTESTHFITMTDSDK